MSPKPPRVIDDAWGELRALTPARIALGRSGAALPTREVLQFGLAHAKARDAVWSALDTGALAETLASQGWPITTVRSRAGDRAAYLARPDWGRRLASDAVLSKPNRPPALVIVLADGLSATAVQRHALPLLASLPGVTPAETPVVIATQARVALADEIGEQLGAALSLCLIGERPGLSAPDSLGAYLTWQPRLGRSDAERNCISNIRPEGLPYLDAARQITALIAEMRRQCCSGVVMTERALPQRDT